MRQVRLIVFSLLCLLVLHQPALSQTVTGAHASSSTISGAIPAIAQLPSLPESPLVRSPSAAPTQPAVSAVTKDTAMTKTNLSPEPSEIPVAHDSNSKLLAGGGGEVNPATAPPAQTNAPLKGSLPERAAKGLLRDETQMSSLPDSPVATGIDPSTGKPKKVVKETATGTEEVSELPERRAMPGPFDPVFPSTEFIGISTQLPIGVPDTNPAYPLERAIWKACPLLKKARIQIYGWANPGMDYSTSHRSNIPLSYSVVPRKFEMDQTIFRIERVPDTVQTQHVDWGFRLTALYGIDYRWTTSQGWYPASNELLSHNKLYGFDPVEAYGMFYIPRVAQGLVLKFGRFISPPDIEAQLAPDNYLWTHSQMFTTDCYTQTGLLVSLMVNKQLTIQGGITAGADIAPWDKAAIPTGLFLARWVSKSNKNSLYGGINSFNNGNFRHGQLIANAEANIANFNSINGTSLPLPPIRGHDNLQQCNLTWSHAFSRRFNTETEGYVLWQFHSLVGGTVNNGTPIPVFQGVGAGPRISGAGMAWGVVTYINYALSKRDYISLRPVDLLGDPKGERTGFKTIYETWTLGWTHRFSDLLCIRPEIRYERALNYSAGKIVTPYDNGTRRYQFTFGADIIQRF